jgi:heme-degrading monooxygenase HmoA
MITVGMNYKVIEGKNKAFEDVFKAVLDKMGEMPGHSESHLYTDVFDGQSYLIVSDWNDRKAFDDFIASDEFRSVANWGKEQILAGRPSHEYYEK